jgi:hypothetical protein
MPADPDFGKFGMIVEPAGAFDPIPLGQHRQFARFCGRFGQTKNLLTRLE